MKNFPLLFCLFQCFFPVQQVHGYASWLKCFVEFDEDEIIMHRKVIGATASSEEVTIQVQPYDGSTDWTSVYSLPSHPTTLRVQLSVSPNLQVEDVQFVLEATNAEFIDRGVMCDGSRAFSRRHDEHVVLKVVDTSLPVEITGLWAKGYEAVTLTPTLQLTAASSSSSEGEL